VNYPKGIIICDFRQTFQAIFLLVIIVMRFNYQNIPTITNEITRRFIFYFFLEQEQLPQSLRRNQP
jgi:hypothetical protein